MYFLGTLLAYGQTASGKTHTIMGDQSDEGIIPRALKDLFVNIDQVTFIFFVKSIKGFIPNGCFDNFFFG